MNKLGIDDIKNDRVAITIGDSGDGLSVKFSGEIDMEDPSGLLDPLFEKVHTGAVDKGVNEVVADFSELKFLNSSGIKSIAKWIMKLGEVEDAYKITIKQNPEITWQATSLQTLTFLVPGAVSVA